MSAVMIEFAQRNPDLAGKIEEITLPIRSRSVATPSWRKVRAGC